VQSTRRNLGLIRAAREVRHEDAAWIKQIEDELERTAEALQAPGA
jgi:hypothetical protein